MRRRRLWRGEMTSERVGLVEGRVAPTLDGRVARFEARHASQLHPMPRKSSTCAPWGYCHFKAAGLVQPSELVAFLRIVSLRSRTQAVLGVTQRFGLQPK